MRRIALTAVALGVAVLCAGCGGGSSSKPSTIPIVVGGSPNLKAFLQLPVATPSSCPSNVSGSTAGRSSPWVGTVDVSVYLKSSITTHQKLVLGNTLREDPLVRTVYYESPKQAFEEFQRLYTCWTSVPRSQAPASYRVVLVRTATIGARDLLVERIARLGEVDSVSCDPSSPCTAALPKR